MKVSLCATLNICWQERYLYFQLSVLFSVERKWVMRWLLGRTMRLVNLVAANEDKDSAAKVNIWIEPANCSISLFWASPNTRTLPHPPPPTFTLGLGGVAALLASGVHAALFALSSSQVVFTMIMTVVFAWKKFGKWNFYRTAIAGSSIWP